MKVIFWVLPIGIITNNLFVKYVGYYDVTFFLINKDTLINACYAAFIFSSVGLLSWLFESTILPPIINLCVVKCDKEVKIRGMVNANRILGRMYHFNPLLHITPELFVKIKSDISELYIIIALWLFCFNSIYLYIAYILFTIIYFCFMAGLNIIIQKPNSSIM
jgi:hypothetical protein